MADIKSVAQRVLNDIAKSKVPHTLLDYMSMAGLDTDPATHAAVLKVVNRKLCTGNTYYQTIGEKLRPHLGSKEPKWARGRGLPAIPHQTHNQVKGFLWSAIDSIITRSDKLADGHPQKLSDDFREMLGNDQDKIMPEEAATMYLNALDMMCLELREARVNQRHAVEMNDLIRQNNLLLTLRLEQAPAEIAETEARSH